MNWGSGNNYNFRNEIITVFDEFQYFVSNKVFEFCSVFIMMLHQLDESGFLLCL